MAEKTGANVAAPESATAEESALGMDDLAARWMTEPSAEGSEEEPEADPAGEEPEPEPQPPAEGEEGEDGEDPEGEEDILARMGLDSASDDDLRELNKALGGRLAPRIGELTEKARRTEEENKALRAELSKRKPFEAAEVRDNPYQDKSTIPELEELFQAAADTIREGEIALEENEDAGADEEIGEFGGRQLTKKQVRAMVRNAKDARDKFLPARLREIERISGYEQARENSLATVRQLHPWLEEDGNDLRESFERVTPDLVAKVRQHMPEYLPVIDLMLADHAQAQHQRRQRTAPAGKTKPREVAAPAKKPPANPGGGGGGSSRPAVQARKRREAKVDAFLQSSGSVDDLAAVFMPQ